MNCPEHLVFQSGQGKYLRVTLWLYYYDVPRHTIPLKVWLNPLRYQLTLVSRFKFLAVINPSGRWWRILDRAYNKRRRP